MTAHIINRHAWPYYELSWSGLALLAVYTALALYKYHIFFLEDTELALIDSSDRRYWMQVQAAGVPPLEGGRRCPARGCFRTWVAWIARRRLFACSWGVVAWCTCSRMGNGWPGMCSRSPRLWVTRTTSESARGASWIMEWNEFLKLMLTSDQKLCLSDIA